MGLNRQQQIAFDLQVQIVLREALAGLCKMLN
jgi:hypothetical protein